MGKLTKAIREEIIKEASKGLFAEGFDALRKRRNVLADGIFDKHIATPAQYAVMKKLPTGFFAVSNSLDIYLEQSGTARSIRVSIKTTEDRRFPAFASGYSRPEILDLDALSEHNEIEKAEAALRIKRDEISAQINGVVWSVNTTKRLLEMWPEGEKFIPEEVVATSGVPMVLVSSMNAAMMSAGVELSSPK